MSNGPPTNKTASILISLARRRSCWLPPAAAVPTSTNHQLNWCQQNCSLRIRSSVKSAGVFQRAPIFPSPSYPPHPSPISSHLPSPLPTSHHKFKTGKTLSLYPPHPGLVRPHLPPLSENPKSSIALAHFTSSASDHAVPMSASPKGMLVVLFVRAGRVRMG